jgi:vitamin B12 transporter
MRKVYMVLGMCLLATSIAQAQVTSYNIDSIMIRENRIQSRYKDQNRNMQLITAEQIKALPVKSAAELLAYVAGVDLQQRGPAGTQADVSIQGSTFDDVLVLINGVKFTDPQTGHNMLNVPVSLTAIDHIEIVYGPAARIYGVDALAGAINIVTKMPVENIVDAQGYSSSSFKQDSSTKKTYYGWGAQATAAMVTKKNRTLFSIAHDESNGYRYNTAFNATRLFIQEHVALSKKSSLDAMGGYVNNGYGANSFYSVPYDLNAKETVQTGLASVGYTYHPNTKFTITPRISYKYAKDDYILVRENPSLYHNIHETNVIDGEVQSILELGMGVLGTGVEVRHEEIKSSKLGNHKRDNAGVYAEYKYNFTNKLNAGAGLYANYNSDYDLEVFPSVDAGYRFLPKWRLFVNGCTGERLPTFTDLYYSDPGNLGNPNLKPEHTTYGEGGVRFSEQYLSAQASYFYKYTTDFIDYTRSSLKDKWQAENFSSISTPGIMLQADYQLSKALKLAGKSDIALNGSYTYLDPTLKKSEGQISKYVVAALRNQFVASLRTVFANKFIFNFNARYQQRIDGNDYTLLDGRIGYRLKQWDLYADVNNILNTQYREISTVQLPGTWYTIGLKYNAAWK